MLVEWKSEYDVGIKLVDYHHKKIVSMINGLYDAMGRRDTKDTVTRIVSALVLYTHKHFQYEEALFASHGYLETAEHKARHRFLVSQVEGLNARIQAEKVLLSVEVMGFLKTWLTDHILAEDQRYEPFLKGKGVV